MLMHMWDGIGWGWPFFFMGLPFLFLLAVVLLVVLLARSSGPSSTTRDSAAERRPSEDSAMAILRDRYARGEIDDEEFNKRRHVLEEPDR
jgi:putative membrane protein